LPDLDDPVEVPPRIVFVTGTDTGVGKTVVTAAIAAAARERQTEVVALKPVATGVTPGSAGDDAERIARAAGHPPRACFTFPAPLSPHLAAEQAGRRIDPVALEVFVLALSAPLTLVEGAGGWEVPLRADYRTSSFARALRAEVVVVAPNRIGVLNHAILTVEAVRRSPCEVSLVVLTPSGSADDPSVASNAAQIAALLGVRVETMPAIDPDDPEALAAAGEPLLRALGVRPGSGQSTPGPGATPKVSKPKRRPSQASS
jgi:dethiobiotin synthetase